MPYKDQFVGWAKETTWGTLVASTQFGRPFPDAFIRRRAVRNPETYLGNRLPDGSFAMPTAAVAEVSVPLVYVGLGKLYEALFGAVTDAGGPTYTHTFKIAEEPTHAGISLELHADLPTNPSRLLEGGRVTRGSWSIRQGEEPRFSFSVVGEQMTLGSASTPTYPDYTQYKILPSQTVVSIGGSNYSCRGLTIEFNPNFDTETAALGGATIVAPMMAPGNAEVSVSFELLDYDATLEALIGSGALTDCVVTCTGPTGPPAYKHEFYIYNVDFSGEEAPASDGGRMPWTLTGTARHKATESAFKLIESNATATT